MSVRIISRRVKGQLDGKIFYVQYKPWYSFLWTTAHDWEWCANGQFKTKVDLKFTTIDLAKNHIESQVDVVEKEYHSGTVYPIHSTEND